MSLYFYNRLSGVTQQRLPSDGILLGEYQLLIEEVAILNSVSALSGDYLYQLSDEAA
jgi:hypothetical protein